MARILPFKGAQDAFDERDSDSEQSTSPFSTIADETRDSPLVLLNFGCGSVFHPAWINVDVAPSHPEIRKADIRRPLPFADASADAVYHSHILEHLDREDAKPFLAENVRVLKPLGILRVAVPDLEELCRAYLVALSEVQRGVRGARELYEWSCLDLLDQMVRRRSCGSMPEFLARIDFASHPRVAARLTEELKDYISDGSDVEPRGLLDRMWRGAWPGSRRRAAALAARLHRAALRVMMRAVGGREAAEAFREGTFRATGEVHRWMYDSYSLIRAVEAAGLSEVRLRGPFESAIPRFAEYELDTVGNRVRRPGSLFVEGRRPATSQALVRSS